MFALEETFTGWISKEPDGPMYEVANYDLHILKEGKTETVGFTYDPQEQLYLECIAFGQHYSTTHSDSGFVVKLHGSLTVTAGPIKAIKRNSLAYVEISPWREKVTDTAKRIKDGFPSLGFDEEMRSISLDEIVRCLPRGEK